MSLTILNAFLPSKYELSFFFNPSRLNYYGHSVVDLSLNDLFNTANVTNDATFGISFHAADLVITNCTLVVNQSESYLLTLKSDRASQLVHLSLPTVKLADLFDESLQIHFNYIGKIRKVSSYSESTFGVFSSTYASNNNKTIIATHCQPAFARYIFPCVDELLCKATFQLTLHTLSQFTCVSNMHVDSESCFSVADFNKLASKFNLPANSTSDNKFSTTSFTESPLMTTSAFGFVLGDLESLEISVKTIDNDSFPIKLYTEQGFSQNGEYALSIAQKAIQILEHLFHSPYPLAKLDFVAFPFLSDGGVENWSMINILKNYVLTTPGNDDNKPLIKQLIIHQLVHQWIGNLISFQSWDHTWLNESLATYISLNLLQPDDDSDEITMKYYNEFASFIQRDSTTAVEPILIQNVGTKSINETFKIHSYEKGIYLLRVLVLLFDKSFEKFMNVLGDFIAEFKYKSFKPTDLWLFLRENHEKKLDIPTIMNSLIRTPGFPLVSCELDDESGKYKLVQHRFIADTDSKSFNEVEDIPYHIPININAIDGGEEDVVIMNDRSLIVKYTQDQPFILNSSLYSIMLVQYTLDQYRHISSNILKLSKLDQFNLMLNFHMLLKQSFYQTTDFVLGFMSVASGFANVPYTDPKLDSKSLSLLMDILADFNFSIKPHLTKSEDTLEKYQAWVNSLVDRFITVHFQNKWDLEHLNNLSEQELVARSVVLSLSHTNTNVQKICKDLHKQLIKKEKVPVVLIPAVVSCTISQGSTKDFKESNALLAISSDYFSTKTHAGILYGMSFSSSKENKSKVLKLYNKPSQLSLLTPDSFTAFTTDGGDTMLWEWYTKNINDWFIKSQKQEIDTSVIHVISTAVFDIMAGSKDKQKVAAFIETKYGKAKEVSSLLMSIWKQSESDYERDGKLNVFDQEDADITGLLKSLEL